MAYENLIVERDGNIAVVTVNRPQARNALNMETWQELDRVMAALDGDPETSVVIITGAGDKAFIAGADIRMLKSREMLECLVSKTQSILQRLADMETVTIAAVNGFALGGGCELAMACDLRIASENAKFGQPEVGLGILPGAGGTQRLFRIVGIGRAKEMILTGEIISALKAEQIGLVNRVVPAGEALNAAKAMARQILAKGPVAVRLAKMVINAGSGVHLEAGLMMERLAQTVLFGTDDRKEGLSAFLERRNPQYRGR